MRLIVRQRESTYFASPNLEKAGGQKTKGCALLPVSEKASDWLLLVPNYLVEPRKRRRRRVAPGGPTVVCGGPHTPSRAVRCQQTHLHSNTPTLAPAAPQLCVDGASQRRSVMECACSC